MSTASITPNGPGAPRTGLFREVAPLLILAALLLTGVAVGVFLMLEGYRDERARRRDEVSAEAVASARQLDQFFNERFEALNAIAAAPVVQTGTREETQAYFERVVAEGSSFSGGLSLIGSDGVMVLLSGFPLGEPPIDLSDRDYVRAVLATDAPALGNAIVGRRSGDPLLTFAVPIRDAGGTTTGVLAGTIRLDIDAAGLSRLALPLGDVIVLDPSDQLVINRGLVDTVEAAPPALLTAIDAISGTSAGVRLPGDDASYVAGLQSVGSTEWRILVVSDEDVLLGAARRSLTWQLALVAVLAAASLLVLAFFAWQRRTDLRLRQGAIALRASQARLAAASQIAPVFLATVDAGLRYTWVFNPDPHWAPTQLLGKRDDEVAPPQDVAELVALKRDALAAAEPTRRQIRVRVGGEWRSYDIYAQQVTDPDGGAGLITAGIDVTEAARREEQLRAAVDAKDEFLSLVSHELRTPMTIIAGNTRVLTQRHGAMSPAEVDSALADVEDASTRLQRVIEDLLVLARPESGAALEKEPLPLRRLLEQAAHEHRSIFTTRNVVVDADGAPPYVLGDRGCIRQVLQNLLSNAEKYSPNPSPIDVSAYIEGGEVVVSVADRGIGVSESEASRLFEPFYRAPGAPDVARGMGIGLAVCKRLVEAMDGRIEARARVGGGAAFLVALPIASVDDDDDDDAASGTGAVAAATPDETEAPRVSVRQA